MSRVVTSLKECPQFNSGNPKLNSGRRSHSGMNMSVPYFVQMLYRARLRIKTLLPWSVGIERRVEKNRRMNKIDCSKEHRKEQEEQIKTDFKFQNEVMEKEDKNSDV